MVFPCRALDPAESLRIDFMTWAHFKSHAQALSMPRYTFLSIRKVVKPFISHNVF